jgi:hypothetical protein
MTKKQKKEHILTNLSLNHCIISDAIEEVCSHAEFEEFNDTDPDFKKEVDRLKAKRDDFVKTVQMDLIAAGDSKQVLEYIKDLNKATDGDTLGSIQREAMTYIIKTADNNSTAIDAFMKIFGCTKYRANQIFSDTLKQNDLISPTVRNKQVEDSLEQSLFKRFERGELNKIEMYQELIKDALYMSQFASREDVRMNAGKLVISYDEHLVNEQDRLRREEEDDDINLIDGFDSLASGLKPSEIQEYRDKLAQETLAITDAEH